MLIEPTQEKLEKRWGYEQPMFDDPGGSYSVKRIVLNEGQCTSLHVHKEKRELLIMVRGILKVEREDWPGPLLMIRDEMKYLEPGIPHRMTALRGDCEYIEVSQGGCETDAERVKL